MLNLAIHAVKTDLEQILILKVQNYYIKQISGFRDFLGVLKKKKEQAVIKHCYRYQE